MIEKIKLISVEPKDGNYAQVENPDVQFFINHVVDGWPSIYIPI
jgi:hypothetical protein